MPRAGLDPAKRPCWLVQSAVFCSARPQLRSSRSEAEEDDKAVQLIRLRGADALEKAAFLKPIRREEKYLKSSLQALHDPAPQGERKSAHQKWFRVHMLGLTICGPHGAPHYVSLE